MDPPVKPPVPKKSCMITLMFPIADDEDALLVKREIDKVVGDKSEKRYEFRIIES